jgi:hypothetical protein
LAYSTLLGLGAARTFFDQIDIVEAVVGDTELGDELKSRVSFHLRTGEGVFALVPRELEGAGTERVRACAAERVPVTNRELEVLLQRLSRDDAILVVPPECERVVRFRTLIRDLADSGEVFLIANHNAHNLFTYAFCNLSVVPALARGSLTSLPRARRARPPCSG